MNDNIKQQFELWFKEYREDDILDYHGGDPYDHGITMDFYNCFKIAYQSGRYAQSDSDCKICKSELSYPACDMVGGEIHYLMEAIKNNTGEI